MSRIWTKKELEQLEKLYPDTDVRIIAKLLNRPISGIYRKASDLGINRSDEWKNKMQMLFSETLKRVGEKTRFKKGLVPLNKGKKWEDYLTEEKINNCKNTQFRKGNIPHNKVAIGTERVLIDGYVQVKLFDGKRGDNWVLKQRLIWEQNYGPIPDGMIVEFIDGNVLNFSIDNLRLASRKENLLRNSTKDEAIVKRFLNIRDKDHIQTVVNEFPNIIETVRQKNKLNYKLSQHGKLDK